MYTASLLLTNASCAPLTSTRLSSQDPMAAKYISIKTVFAKDFSPHIQQGKNDREKTLKTSRSEILIF